MKRLLAILSFLSLFSPLFACSETDTDFEEQAFRERERAMYAWQVEIGEKKKAEWAKKMAEYNKPKEVELKGGGLSRGELLVGYKRIRAAFPKRSREAHVSITNDCADIAKATGYSFDFVIETYIFPSRTSAFRLGIDFGKLDINSETGRGFFERSFEYLAIRIRKGELK